MWPNLALGLHVLKVVSKPIVRNTKGPRRHGLSAPHVRAGIGEDNDWLHRQHACPPLTNEVGGIVTAHAVQEEAVKSCGARRGGVKGLPGTSVVDSMHSPAQQRCCRLREDQAVSFLAFLPAVFDPPGA